MTKPITDLVAAARACCAVARGEFLGPAIDRLREVLGSLPPDAVVVSRKLLLDAAEVADSHSADPYDDVSDPELAAALRLAAGDAP